MKRRDFLKYSMCGLTALALGSINLPPIFRKREADAAGLTVDLSMEEAMVEMVDKTQVYFWLFKQSGAALPSIPGPVIFAYAGDRITLNITNNLDEIHEFRIIAAGPGGKNVNTGPVLPGQTVTRKFVAREAGTYMYLDPRNAPVNRVLGLHGAFIVLPAEARHAAPGPGLVFPNPAVTPYTNPTAQVQQLFNDLGTQPFFAVRPGEPGQSWAPVRPAGQPVPEPLRMALQAADLPADELARLAAMEPFLFRTRIWVFNAVDPRFNAVAEAGGNAEPAGGIDPQVFRAEFLGRYFMTNGKSGFYSSTEHTAPDSALAAYIGEPHVVRILNAGLPTFSPHLHANHFYVLAVNNIVLESLTTPDTMTLGRVENDLSLNQLGTDPLGAGNRLFLDGGSRVDWLVPFIRPPDIPGDPNTVLEQLIPEELATVIDGKFPLSPQEYPMHSHVELEQTAAGGNYPQGLITHFIFLGELINGVEVPFPVPV